MHTFLGVPILSGSKSYGSIYLTEKIDADMFTIDDEIVIETLAAYAAIAIKNAVMYGEIIDRDKAIKQHNQDLTLLDNLAKILAASLEENEIMSQTLSHITQYMGVEAGEIFLREEGTKEFRLAMHRGEAAEAFWTRDRFLVGEGFVGRVAQLGEVLVSTSLDTDMRFLRRAVVNEGFKALVAIPLNARGKVVGVMTIATKKNRQFETRELDLLEAIGTWAGTAIENARLHRQARRLAVLEERERIGMDLHDGTIQSVYAVGLSLEYAKVALHDDPELAEKKIDQSITGLNKAIQDIRSYILDLRPRQMRGNESLEHGILRLMEEFRENTDAEAYLTTSTTKHIELPQEKSTALFHICQEALGNTAKHARAQRVEIRIWSIDDRVLLEIQDDGNGFDIEGVSFNIGHGLSNMHRRARRVGGDVEITSQHEVGTTVTAWVPVNTNESTLNIDEEE
jgi:signal transduction histidine kinase